MDDSAPGVPVPACPAAGGGAHRVEQGRSLSSRLDFVGRQPAWLLWGETLLLVALVAGLNKLAGAEISLSIFYLGPVVFATWYISRRSGVATAALSAALWLYFDVTVGRPYANPAAPWWNMLVRFGFFAITLYLVDSLRRAHARERDLSLTDSLTGIPNSRSFREKADLVLAQARRRGTPVTVAFIDLDRFKAVNDTLGHAEGDAVLCAVAAVLRNRLRASDLYARMGGDEFVVLLPEAGKEEAEQVLRHLSEAMRAATDRWPVDQTIGAAVFKRPRAGKHGPPGDVEELVRAADALMYQGKRAGRGRVLVRDADESGPGPE